MRNAFQDLAFEQSAMLKVSPSILDRISIEKPKTSLQRVKIYNLRPRNDCRSKRFHLIPDKRDNKRVNESYSKRLLLPALSYTLWITGWISFLRYSPSLDDSRDDFTRDVKAICFAAGWIGKGRDSHHRATRWIRAETRGGEKKKKDNVYTKNINLHAYSFETSQYLIVLARDIYFVPRWKLSTGFTLFLHRAQNVYKRIFHIPLVFFFIVEAFNYQDLSLKGKNVDLIIVLIE